MTTISAKIIADSIAPGGSRLTTLQLRYPRWIHAEFMTHRVFSRNASSSRAIPVKRLIADILADPAIPLYWGKAQAGMQAREENESLVFYDQHTYTREEAWLAGMESAVALARAFDEAGYHKQLVNRLLEPWSHINVVVTATEWTNFFELRDHPDAEPHIRMLAQVMRSAMDASLPRSLSPGEWHLPYISEDFAGLGQNTSMTEVAIKCSVARCARVSYLTTEGSQPIVQKDLELYEQLVGAKPLHASPAEHQACVRPQIVLWSERAPPTDLHGNFAPQWIQYRKILVGLGAL